MAFGGYNGPAPRRCHTCGNPTFDTCCGNPVATLLMWDAAVHGDLPEFFLAQMMGGGQGSMGPAAAMFLIAEEFGDDDF